jgi:HAD superfamily hydrolase (TIGR01509 family)
MQKYRALLFDLFGTVALLDIEKLPLFEWEGRATPATTGALRALYEQQVTDVPFLQFFSAMTAVNGELRDARAHDLREVSCAQRFLLTLIRAGIADSSATRRLAAQLARAHASLVASATEVPPGHVSFLEQASARYSLALVSNFDHGPTARQLLHDRGLKEHFHHIVISEEHGWCKPHPQIFADTLAGLGVKPEEALFIGDSPFEDVAGAKGVGMDAVWVNAHDQPLPRGIPVPDYAVRSIPELELLLFDRDHRP